MTYLDYSATTFVDDEVLKAFSDNFNIKATEKQIDKEKRKIQEILSTELEVLYTSGATESNNWAIKSIANQYDSSLGYHIITTRLEHSSINETLKYLEKKGFVIDYVELKNGVVCLDSLKKLINDKTILITIASVNSEVGILQPIEEIGRITKEYPKVVFHSDMTQSMGKIKLPLTNVDLVSFTSHKFFGLKGIGCLLKKPGLLLEPLFYGNRDYNYALITSMTKALSNALNDIDIKYQYVLSLKNKIITELEKYTNITINSKQNVIPHILNISVANYKPETFLHTLEFDDIFISTKSACSSDNSKSQAVYAITNNLEISKTSVRISLSYKTNKEDVNHLIRAVQKCLRRNDYE